MEPWGFFQTAPGVLPAVRRQAAILSALGLAGSAGMAGAAGYYLPNQDAFATARGNAWVATADGAAAVHYNPAGLTQLERPEASVGLYSIQLGNEAHINGVSYTAEKEWQLAPNLFYAQPLNDCLTAGFGVNSPYGMGIDWGQNTPFRTLATEAHLMYVSTTAALGWQITDTFSVGASLSLNYAELELGQGLGFMPADFLNFKGDGFAPSAGLGVRWQPHEQHAFGLMYSSATSFDLTGNLESNLIVNGPAKMDFMTPARIAGGYSWRPAPGWNVEFNVEWLDWDSLNSLVLRGATVPGVGMPIAFNWQSTFIYELGVSYKMDNGWMFAVGYDYNSNALPDKTFTPVVSDADRQWINLGFGREYDSWRWFLAYQYGFSDRVVSGGTPSPAGQRANGKYESDYQALMVTCTHRF